jgi:DNA-binding MarR family transcriptional regulator
VESQTSEVITNEAHLTRSYPSGYAGWVAGFFEDHSESIATRVAIGLNKLGLAMKSRAWAGAGARGLTPTQGQILALLRARRRALRLTQVAEELGISPPTASDSVRALVDKGLVRKTRSKDDARAVALELTTSGKAEAACAATFSDFLLDAIDALSPAEQEAFLVALIKMIGVLVERGQISTQRMCLSCRHFRANESGARDPQHHCELHDAPLGRRYLRLDCSDYAPACEESVRESLRAFAVDRPWP